VPYTRGRHAYLLLDEFKGHTCGETLNLLSDYNITVDFIPGGYTSVLQSLDVGINKPFKSHVRELWNRWAIEAYHNIPGHGRPPKPSREELSKFIVGAWERITPEIIKNTFKQIGYTNTEQITNEPTPNEGVIDESQDEVVEALDILRL